MDDLTPEELSLLAEEAEAVADAEDAAVEPEAPKPTRRRKAEHEAGPEPAPPTSILRGPHTPVQFDDDGWAGLPVQMRG